MARYVKKILQIVLFFAIGFFVIGLVYRRQNKAYQDECLLKGIEGDCSLFQKILDDFGNANYFWLFIPVLLFMISNIFRALRWRMLFNAMGYYPRMVNLFGTIMVNYLTNLGIPRSGELIRGGLISKYEAIPIEKAMGTIVTDRIFDVIMLLLTFGIAIIVGGNSFIEYLGANANLENLITKAVENWLLVSFLGLVFLGLSTYIWRNRTKLMQSNLAKRINNIIYGFWQGIKSVQGVSSISLFTFYTFAIWILYYFMLYLAFFAFMPTYHLGPDAGLMVFVFGSLGIVIPTPGGMGSYHFLVGEALAMYGISGADGFSFANLVYFSITIFATLLFGSISAITLPIINKS